MAIVGFGGVYSFSRRSWETFEAAEPGSPTAAKILLGLLHLPELTAPARPDFATMSDVDLARTIAKAEKRIAVKVPGAAV
jgi:hypothetical protein